MTSLFIVRLPVRGRMSILRFQQSYLARLLEISLNIHYVGRKINLTVFVTILPGYFSAALRGSRNEINYFVIPAFKLSFVFHEFFTVFGHYPLPAGEGIFLSRVEISTVQV
ncbi:MAG: hypothetical protein RL059_1010 [Bacteroidota bacterium]